MCMGDCVIMDGMKDYAISKMDGAFSSEDEMLQFLNEDYHIIGDDKSFLVYYKMAEVYWVHFLWASNKRLMYRVLKEFEKIAPPKHNIILFNSDNFAEMFGNHASKVYVWTKELK